MEPFIALVAVTAILLLLGGVGVRPLRRWPVPLRGGLAAMFVLTGVSHFVGMREELISYVPPGLPEPALLITITGVLELAGAAGLLIRRTAPLAAGCLAALLITMFPANLYAALAGIATDPLSQPVPRTLFQLVFVAAAVAVVIAERRATAATRPTPPPPAPATPGQLAGRRR
ncbi:DoxX family protein [Microlunatus parietis]|uniref:Putative membrane protein n=1 Tax=Microlunatus parietis TaxID=682979 RepID=A0A7Y9I527_9ACTN|nr:DoxX family membrane protein [Microlunatus parietis]NYE70451.1 putative membrane protein [Microlunatus parietis]